jgi:hypothetical protein
MRLRLCLLSALFVSLIIVSGDQQKLTAIARSQPTKSVYLGGVVFQPGNVAATGTATLTVSVATGTDVPPIGADNSMPIKAVIQINENSNTSSINYTITPSQVEKLDLAGAGKSSMINFKFVMNSQNTKGGAISCRATLVNLENAGSLAQLDGPTAMDAVLSVAPPPTPTPTPTPSPEATP